MAGYGSVLVYEDNPLVLMDAEETLYRRGFARVLTARSEPVALSMARDEMLQFALVSAFTTDADGACVADQLAARGVPFAFSCDFADGSDRPERWHKVPFLVRPYTESDVSGLLAQFGL